VIDLTCFKAYDIRGEIGVNIDEDIAYRIGRATAQHLKAKTVVIGFDARETSPAFAAAAATGVVGSGIKCVEYWYVWYWGNVLGGD
jgi:phosphomannomutase